MKQIRRLRMIRNIFAVIIYAFTFLGTGVAIITISAVFLIILPLIALISICFVFALLIQRKRICRKIIALTTGKNVLVFFPPKGCNRKSFLSSMAIEHAKSTDSVSIIVSPFFIAPDGLVRKARYISAREDSPRIILVRKFTFFCLKRKFAESKETKAIIFY